MKDHFTDAHCHLTDLRFAAEGAVLDLVMERSRRAGIQSWALGGVDPADWNRQAELKARFPKNIFTSYGLHP